MGNEITMQMLHERIGQMERGVHKRLGEVSSEHHRRADELKEDIGRTEATLGEVKRDLHGNGGVGALERLRANEDALSSLTTRIDKMVGRIGKLMWPFAIGVGGFLLKFLFDVFVWWVRKEGRGG